MVAGKLEIRAVKLFSMVTIVNLAEIANIPLNLRKARMSAYLPVLAALAAILTPEYTILDHDVLR